MKKINYLAPAVSLLALFVYGCSSPAPAPAPAAPPAAAAPAATEAPAAAAPAAADAAPIDAATVGSVSGKVSFEGTAPEATKLKMSADAYCMSAHGTTAVMADGLVVNKDNTLKNVFVYVKDGLGARTFTAPTEPVELTQQGCMFSPHVFGVMAGQGVVIHNGDGTLHNVHAMPTVNDEFNIAMPVKDMKIPKSFPKPEVLVRFKCDVHPWMSSFAGVVSHPFYAVSGDSGTFELKGLPPGTYTISAVHESLGEQTAQVVIGASEAKTADFTFKAAN